MVEIGPPDFDCGLKVTRRIKSWYINSFCTKIETSQPGLVYVVGTA